MKMIISDFCKKYNISRCVYSKISNKLCTEKVGRTVEIDLDASKQYLENEEFKSIIAGTNHKGRPRKNSVSEPVVSKPVVSKPVVSELKSTESEPVVSKPVVSELKSTESEPVVSEPVVSEPVVSEPVEIKSIKKEKKVNSRKADSVYYITEVAALEIELASKLYKNDYVSFRNYIVDTIGYIVKETPAIDNNLSAMNIYIRNLFGEKHNDITMDEVLKHVKNTVLLSPVDKKNKLEDCTLSINGFNIDGYKLSGYKPVIYDIEIRPSTKEHSGYFIVVFFDGTGEKLNKNLAILKSGYELTGINTSMFKGYDNIFTKAEDLYKYIRSIKDKKGVLIGYNNNNFDDKLINHFMHIYSSFNEESTLIETNITNDLYNLGQFIINGEKKLLLKIKEMLRSAKIKYGVISENESLPNQPKNTIIESILESDEIKNLTTFRSIANDAFVYEYDTIRCWDIKNGITFAGIYDTDIYTLDLFKLLDYKPRRVNTLVYIKNNIKNHAEINDNGEFSNDLFRNRKESESSDGRSKPLKTHEARLPYEYDSKDFALRYKGKHREVRFLSIKEAELNFSLPLTTDAELTTEVMYCYNDVEMTSIIFKTKNVQDGIRIRANMEMKLKEENIKMINVTKATAERDAYSISIDKFNLLNLTTSEAGYEFFTLYLAGKSKKTRREIKDYRDSNNKNAPYNEKVNMSEIISNKIIFEDEETKKKLSDLKGISFYRKACEISAENEDDSTLKVLPSCLTTFTFTYANGKKISIDLKQGGLHYDSSIRKVNNRIVCGDISSYYPSIILNLYDEGLNVFPFEYRTMLQSLYRQMTIERKSIKKINPIKADALKLILNSFFGRMNYKYSFLYNEVSFYRTTINGQLQLLMAIEQLVKNNIEIIQANTDGIFCSCPTENEEKLVKSILNKWASSLNLGIDFEIGVKYVALSQNSYILVTDSGKKKVKGKEFSEGKESLFPIIKDAIKEFAISNISPTAYIFNESDIFRFCNSFSSGQLETITFNNKFNKKVNRAFISKFVANESVPMPLLKKCKNGSVIITSGCNQNESEFYISMKSLKDIITSPIDFNQLYKEFVSNPEIVDRHKLSPRCGKVKKITDSKVNLAKPLSFGMTPLNSEEEMGDTSIDIVDRLAYVKLTLEILIKLFDGIADEKNEVKEHKFDSVEILEKKEIDFKLISEYMTINDAVRKTELEKQLQFATAKQALKVILLPDRKYHMIASKKTEINGINTEVHTNVDDIDFETFTFLCPNPISTKGLNQNDNNLTPRNSEVVYERYAYVFECDSVKDQEALFSIIQKYTSCVCYSGNKSLHGFLIFNKDMNTVDIKYDDLMSVLKQLLEYSHIDIKPVTSVSSFFRMPNGFNYDTNKRQFILQLRKFVLNENDIDAMINDLLDYVYVNNFKIYNSLVNKLSEAGNKIDINVKLNSIYSGKKTTNQAILSYEYVKFILDKYMGGDNKLQLTIKGSRWWSNKTDAIGEKYVGYCPNASVHTSASSKQEFSMFNGLTSDYKHIIRKKCLHSHCANMYQIPVKTIFKEMGISNYMSLESRSEFCKQKGYDTTVAVELLVNAVEKKYDTYESINNEEVEMIINNANFKDLDAIVYDAKSFIGCIQASTGSGKTSTTIAAIARRIADDYIANNKTFIKYTYLVPFHSTMHDVNSAFRNLIADKLVKIGHMVENEATQIASSLILYVEGNEEFSTQKSEKYSLVNTSKYPLIIATHSYLSPKTYSNSLFTKGMNILSDRFVIADEQHLLFKFVCETNIKVNTVYNKSTKGNSDFCYTESNSCPMKTKLTANLLKNITDKDMKTCDCHSCIFGNFYKDGLIPNGNKGLLAQRINKLTQESIKHLSNITPFGDIDDITSKDIIHCYGNVFKKVLNESLVIRKDEIQFIDEIPYASTLGDFINKKLETLYKPYITFELPIVVDSDSEYIRVFKKDESIEAIIKNKQKVVFPQNSPCKEITLMGVDTASIQALFGCSITPVYKDNTIKDDDDKIYMDRESYVYKQTKHYAPVAGFIGLSATPSEDFTQVFNKIATEKGVRYGESRKIDESLAHYNVNVMHVSGQTPSNIMSKMAKIILAVKNKSANKAVKDVNFLCVSKYKSDAIESFNEVSKQDFADDVEIYLANDVLSETNDNIFSKSIVDKPSNGVRSVTFGYPLNPKLTGMRINNRQVLLIDASGYKPLRSIFGITAEMSKEEKTRILSNDIRTQIIQSIGRIFSKSSNTDNRVIILFNSDGLLNLKDTSNIYNKYLDNGLIKKYNESILPITSKSDTAMVDLIMESIKFVLNDEDDKTIEMNEITASNKVSRHARNLIKTHTLKILNSVDEFEKVIRNSIDETKKRTPKQQLSDLKKKYSSLIEKKENKAEFFAIFDKIKLDF